MTINKNQEGSVLHVALEGRLDTITAPELEAECNASCLQELVILLALSGRGRGGNR